MKANQRAAIAYIVARVIHKKKSSAVYDYSQSMYVSIDGTVEADRINVYDYGQGCHISGNSRANNKYSLYHYGDSHHIDLEIFENKFKGYDYGTSSHFEGSVNGNNINVYDYSEGAYFGYSI